MTEPTANDAERAAPTTRGLPLANEDARIERVLVATDFSQNADHALEWAIMLAKTQGASIHLVHAVPTGEPGDLTVELERVVGTRMAEAQGVVDAAGLEHDSVFRSGHPWNVIVGESIAADVDVIIVGARGHTALPELLLGSTADRVLRTASVPVVTVHRDDPIPTACVSTAVAAIDFSEESERAVDVVASLLNAGPGKARLVLMHAIEVPPVFALYEVGAGFEAVQDADARQAIDKLERIAAQYRSDHLDVEVMVECAYPATLIEEVARNEKADMVALGTHGRSGWRRFFMGSLAERTVRHAPCPVLTMRLRA